MSEPGVRRWADAVASPWRNGGGVTHELASAPAGVAFDWRVSVADVTAAGAFSTFPGITRTIVLVEGAAMTLTVDGTDHALAPHRPFRFDGAAPTSCTPPAGPVRALNVMTRRGRCRAEVEMLDATTGRVRSDADVHLLVALAGPVAVATEGGPALTLDRYDLHRSTGTDLTLAGVGPVAHIGIRPTPPSGDDAAQRGSRSSP